MDKDLSDIDIKKQNEVLLKEADTLYTVEGAIRERMQKLSEIKEKMKKYNEMMKSYLEGSEEYMTASKEAKDASAKKASIKRDLLAKPEAQGIPDKIMDVREEKRELEEALSYYLTQYQALSGTNEFEDENGELKQIVYVAKLVKRSGGK